jgi:HK97 family phage prohead protease
MIDTRLAARDTGQRVSVRRAYAAQFALRASSKGKGLVQLDGYASVYDTPYEMWDWLGSYTEVTRGGAGKKTLSENPQTQFLLNHEGLAMAYTHADTLNLSEDSTGLAVEAHVNPKRSDVADMITAIEDGNLTEMSFAFEIIRQVWSQDFMQRDIIEYSINRGDVSAVNFGANPATSIEKAARALDFDHMSPEGARALYERLGRLLTVDEVPATTPPPAAAEARTHSLALARARLALLD